MYTRAIWEKIFGLTAEDSEALRAFLIAQDRCPGRSPVEVCQAAAEEMQRRVRGFRVPPSSAPAGAVRRFAKFDNFETQQQKNSASAIIELMNAIAIDFLAKINKLESVRGGHAPPPSLPRAAPGICLTPRLLAQVPAAVLAGR